jgi:hypothetical protein
MATEFYLVNPIRSARLSVIRLMKKSYILSVICSLSFGALSTFAQGMPGGNTHGMDLSFVKLFGENPAFTARSEMKISDKTGKEVMSMSTTVAMLGGKMRTEVDMNTMKGAMFPPAALAQMKQMGMDHTINLARADKKLVYIVFPGMKSYASMPIPEATIQSMSPTNKMEKTELGKEAIDGHPCVKSKITTTDDNGKPREFIVWNATDLKDFPVQFQTSENGQTVTSTYKNIKLGKPDEKQFDPPADFKGYNDVQEMMMSAMQKMMQQNAPNSPQAVPAR